MKRLVTKRTNIVRLAALSFGIQGWIWGPPVPKSITFFLDGTAMVCDQYGRQIRRSVSASGVELRFADTPPVADREGTIVARPQFATHAQTIAALAAEQIDWLAYEVRWRDKSGALRMQGRLTVKGAAELQTKLVQDGNPSVLMDRTISCAGWPQLPYEKPKDGGACLKDLAEVPPTPEAELMKIRDPQLRKDALRMRREADEARVKELQVAAE